MNRRFIPVEEFLNQQIPRFSDVALTFNAIAFLVLCWDDQLWLRAREIEQALGLPTGYTSAITRRFKGKFNKQLVRVTMVPGQVFPNGSRRKKRKNALFSLGGLVVLAKCIGTPAALDLGAWAHQHAEDYEYPPPDENGSQ